MKTEVIYDPPMSALPVRKHATPVIDQILERLEFKCCPQGLNVMVEELQWMGQSSTTYDKLWQSIRVELRKRHPRLSRVAEGVYWFADRSIPAGWSLYQDRRMLPCFYRQYPPAIAWDDIDKSENILPRPDQRG